MRLVPDARQIALRSYSMWSMYLGVICVVLPEVLFFVWGIDTDPMIWWVSALCLLIFGIVGRMVAQPQVRSPRRMAVLSVLFLLLLVFWSKPALAQSTEAGFSQVAIPLVAKWEGKENHAYFDRIASPPVWTVCYGETRGVKAGDHYTDAQCKAMLEKGLLEYRAGLHRHFTNETKSKRLTPQRDAAYVSLAWNVGIAGAGRSTATRRLNAGDIAGGCTAITWWNRAGKYVIRGLVNRRADEYRLCMAGL